MCHQSQADQVSILMLQKLENIVEKKKHKRSIGSRLPSPRDVCLITVLIVQTQTHGLDVHWLQGLAGKQNTMHCDSEV